MIQSASFRDPEGFVLQTGSQVFRVVRDDAAEVLKEFLASGLGKKLVDSGVFVGSRAAGSDDRLRILDQTQERVRGWSQVTVLEHTPVRFPSFPHEWPSVMLREASLLTLEIAEQLLHDGFGLKDATPYNILFNGPDAVLVDALSVERRDPTDPIWRPLGQFLQTFLYPLLLESATGAPSHTSLVLHREGVSVDEIYRRLSLSQRLSPRFVKWVSMTSWLGRKKAPSSAGYGSRKVDPALAKRMLKSNFRSLRSAIESIPVAGSEVSTWSHYSRACHYDDASRQTKRDFVQRALARFSAGHVLDLGANDGEYSFLSAGAGHNVLAADLDPVAVNRLWTRAKSEKKPILPLVLNLANPTPALGWGNRECRSFLDRAAGRFDCVLMLALLHHLTVTERIPIPMVLDLAQSLTKKYLVIEWVSPADPMYQALLRGRDDLHQHDTREAFEAACKERFEMTERCEVVAGRRWLYLLAKK